VTTTLEYHDAANILPLDRENLDALAADIKANGQRLPIELLDGKILDGRRRYLACGLAGVEPQFVPVKVSDPVAHVASLNLHRRHLTPAQRAMCAAWARALRATYAAEAKGRQRARKGSQPGASQEYVPDLQPGESVGQTRDQLGEQFGISGRSVAHADRVLAHAVPVAATMPRRRQCQCRDPGPARPDPNPRGGLT
jgi:hypothetical protein